MTGRSRADGVERPIAEPGTPHAERVQDRLGVRYLSDEQAGALALAMTRDNGTDARDIAEGAMRNLSPKPSADKVEAFVERLGLKD